MVNSNLSCQVCKMPHSLDHCVVAESIQQEEIPYENEEEDHTIYLTSHNLHPIKQEYSSSRDKGYKYDVNNQRYNIHMAEQ